jgi:hypothetical protein
LQPAALHQVVGLQHKFALLEQRGLELFDLVEKGDQVQRDAAHQLELGANAGQLGIGRVPDLHKFVFEIDLQLTAQKFAELRVHKEVLRVFAHIAAGVARQQFGVNTGWAVERLGGFVVQPLQPGVEHAFLQGAAFGIKQFVVGFVVAGLSGFGFVALGLSLGGRAPLPAQLEPAVHGFEGGGEKVLVAAFGVVFGDVGLLQHKAHFAFAITVGKAGEHFTAFDVVAAFGGPVKVGVLPVVGHGVSGAAAAPGAGDEVAVIPVAAKKRVQVVVTVGGFVVGQGLAAGGCQFGGPGGDALGQGLVQVSQHLLAPVGQDAVDTEVQLGGVELEDVVLQQVQKPLLRRGGVLWGLGVRHKASIVTLGRLTPTIHYPTSWFS